MSNKVYPPVMVSFVSTVFSFEEKVIVPKRGKNKGQECSLSKWSSPMPQSDHRSLGGDFSSYPNTLWVRCSYFGSIPGISKFDQLQVTGQFKLTDFGLEFIVLDYFVLTPDGE